MDYEAIVNEKDFTNLDKYAITAPYTSAIPLYLEKFKQGNYSYAKCHIIGPFTWGTSLCGEDGVCAFYDETYREVLIKGLTLKAVWQIQQIKKPTLMQNQLCLWTNLLCRSTVHQLLSL